MEREPRRSHRRSSENNEELDGSRNLLDENYTNTTLAARIFSGKKGGSIALCWKPMREGVKARKGIAARENANS